LKKCIVQQKHNNNNKKLLTNIYSFSKNVEDAKMEENKNQSLQSGNGIRIVFLDNHTMQAHNREGERERERAKEAR
jgi:hypothetical protein